MTVKYFEDTDTALLVFSESEPVETREVNENVYLDLDVNGALVSMTIEHAREGTSLPQVVIERFGSRAVRE